MPATGCPARTDATVVQGRNENRKRAGGLPVPHVEPALAESDVDRAGSQCRSDRGELGAKPLDVMNLARPEPDARMPEGTCSSRERRVVGDEHGGRRACIREHIGIGRIRGKHFANLDDVLALVVQEVRDTSGHVVVEEPPQQSSNGLCEGDGDVLASEIREFFQDPVSRPPVRDHPTNCGRRDAGSSHRRLTGKDSPATFDPADT